MPGTTTIFNDNNACVNWSKKCTTKGLRHIQMRENLVRENVENKFISVKHVGGKVNLADLFTKEMKDTTHFVELRNLMLRPRYATLLIVIHLFILRGVLVTYFKIPSCLLFSFSFLKVL